MKSIPVSVSSAPDVAALAADDAALELVGLELHHGHGRLGHVPGGDPLHDRRQDAAGAPLGVVARLLLDLSGEPRRIVAQLVLELAHQDLLGLGRAQAADALELPHVVALGRLELLCLRVEVAGAVLERGLAAVELAQPHVERLLLGAQALLDPGDLFAAGA